MSAEREGIRPDVGDPVVIGGTKYRIRALVDGSAQLAEAGPHWRTSPVILRVGAATLTYHRRAGVFRIEPKR